MTTPIARIYLVRHGETQANRDQIIQGHQDTALNERGFEQSRLLGKALKKIKFHDVAFSSDLCRAVSVSDASSGWYFVCLYVFGRLPMKS
jgi:probable phosphoglycerate mutase